MERCLNNKRNENKTQKYLQLRLHKQYLNYSPTDDGRKQLDDSWRERCGDGTTLLFDGRHQLLYGTVLRFINAFIHKRADDER